jgi:hypothetical protein
MVPMDWGIQRGSAPAVYQEFLVPGMFAPFDETIECTWASHPEFARRYIAASPIESVFAAVPDHAQQAVSDEVAERLAPHATADGSLRMPMTTNIAVGRA